MRCVPGSYSFIAGLFALFANFPVCAFGADIVVQSGVLQIDGQLSGAAVEKVRSLLPNATRNRYDGTLHVSLRSVGGDVDAAMAIGRLLRDAEASISTCTCSSSCVLVLVAGVRRGGCSGGQRIGVHRIYQEHVPASLSLEEIRAARTRNLLAVRSYLDEMSASPSLVDLMESIPPEETRYLTEDEQRRFGLLGDDAAWNEKHVARQAAKYGIKSAEFRRRDVLAKQKCDPILRRDLYAWKETDDCREAVMWGVSPAEYSASEKIASEACKGREKRALEICLAKVHRERTKK